MHIDDLANAYYFLLQNNNEAGLVNIASGKDLFIKEIVMSITA
jgi:GDP-L-fucose synthase